MMMMKPWPLAAIVLLSSAAPVLAVDPVGYVAPDGVNTVPVTAATPMPVTVGTPLPVSGAVAVTQATAANLNAQVQGTSAAGAADDGSNPVKAGGIYQSTPTALTSGYRGALQTDSFGNLRVQFTGAPYTGADGVANNLLIGPYSNASQTVIGIGNTAPYLFNGSTWDRLRSAGATGAAAVGGAAADGAATAGNPVFVGGQYLSAPSALTSGQTGGLITDNRRNLRTVLCGTTQAGDASTACVAAGAHSEGFGGTFVSLSTFAQVGLQGSSACCYTARDITAAAAGGTGTLSVAGAPTSSASAAIAPATSLSVASNQVLKSSAGNGYRYAITTGASAGFLMVFDATSLPANGAVTPKICRAVPANSSLEIDHSGAPDRFSTGIVEGFSTTGCYNLTASATSELEGWVE